MPKARETLLLEIVEDEARKEVGIIFDNFECQAEDMCTLAMY